MREENGFVLATGMIVLMIVMLLGIAVVQMVTAQTHQSGHEENGEAAFNLAESALDAEAAQLQNSWPNSSASAWTTACTNASASSFTGCPGPSLTTSFSSTYSGVQYANPTWSVQVLDDTNGGSYSDSMVGVAPAWDSNQNNNLWIRASATVNGQKRTVAAEITRQITVIPLPHNVITAGGVFTSNDGNKVIIESKDPNSGLSGPVALRCTTAVASYQSSCAGWDPNKGQLDPSGNFQTGYIDPNGGTSALPSTALDSLRSSAKSNGTYYNGTCPPAGQTGVVFVDNASCTYQANTTWNSAASPGALIFYNGTATFNGNLDFYGIVYMADQMPGAQGLPCTPGHQNGPVMTVHGGGTLHGAIFVDNCGTVDAGDSAFNVEYDSSAFGGFSSYATPSMAKNTFRIVSNG
jgi:type II secretory pathway pseudopilin PulG